MARYIDSEELCRRITECWETNDVDKGRLIQQVIDRVITPIVVGTPTADVVEVSKWIDIKERLPKDNEKVLCLCQADIYEVLTWDNVQMEWVHDSNHIYFKTFVRYWQPLPEYPSDAKMDGERKHSN